VSRWYVVRRKKKVRGRKGFRIEGKEWREKKGFINRKEGEKKKGGRPDEKIRGL